MTQEQQDKLRRALYNAKFTTDAEDENPFVGVYFDNLLAIIEKYVEPPIYHEGWLAGEANLAKEYKNIQWVKWIPVEKELPKENGCYLCYNCIEDEYEILFLGGGDWRDGDGHCVTNVVTHWMPLPQPPRKED